MPPKDDNIFAVLAGSSCGAGSPGTRDAKKKARAAEHRRSRATTRTSSSPCLPPGTPFFTLAVEGPNTAVALDADGAEIVSLHFDDFDDLISDSFREYAAAAVAAVTAASSSESAAARTHLSVDGTAEIIDLTENLAENSDDDDEFYDIIEMENGEGGLWSYEGHTRRECGDDDEGGSGALDFDAEFAAALAEAAAMMEVHDEAADADLALALALQEEEEAAAAAERSRQAAGNAWGRPPGGSSFSSVLEPRIPAYGAAASRIEAVDSDFPSLGLSPSGATTGLSGQQQAQRRVPLRVAMAASRAQGVRVVQTNASVPAPYSNDSSGVDEVPAVPAALPGLPGFMRADDQLARPAEFLDSVGDDAVQARADALRWARESADREGPSGGGSGLDSATVKRMMDSSAGARPASGTSGSSRSQSAATAAATTAGGEPEGDEPERGLYSRKSIRKLVLDMIAAGWEPLWGRGGGHLVYQRLIPPTGHKQLLVLPCTPSDRRSIEATHARLQRMDREAAEVRRRAAEAAARGGG